jgi:ATP-binding cassette subfamily B protein
MLFLSLLRPQRGALELDGVPVAGGEIGAWHSLSAQVSQNFQLLDDSVIANIAFGEDQDSIDHDRVWDALEAAQLDGLVSELPYGVYTQVGENGINLSGGQRQRVALARAFYCQAKFLVLDEATSSLDNQTESDVIQSLEIIGRRCTTLVIAHRLTTIQRCDRIYELCNGEIVAQGDFSELQEISPAFRNLVSLQSSTHQG